MSRNTNAHASRLDMMKTMATANMDYKTIVSRTFISVNEHYTINMTDKENF